jgi:hypothetical protein
LDRDSVSRRQADSRKRENPAREFGVPNIWVIDAETLESEIHMQAGSRKVADGILRVEDTSIEVPLHGLDED